MQPLAVSDVLTLRNVHLSDCEGSPNYLSRTLFLTARNSRFFDPVTLPFHLFELHQERIFSLAFLRAASAKVYSCSQSGAETPLQRCTPRQSVVRLRRHDYLVGGVLYRSRFLRHCLLGPSAPKGWMGLNALRGSSPSDSAS